MSKKFLLICLLLVSSVSLVFARDVKEKSVGAENSWQESFDINNKKQGKYNIVVTAEDKAGNIEVSGPYNIYIDAESDLPVTRITNPVSQMRITGNLNIVGTCIDDDKVAAVYLVFDGDEENAVKAEGTEFWSYYLDTTQLVEGPHTIEAYGVDDGNPEAYRGEDGKIDMSKVVPKTGYRAKVVWQLDRRAPVIELNKDNHYMGELLSGKINLVGTVVDGNGISKLEYSIDGGKNYQETKIQQCKRKTPDENGLYYYYTFSVSIDTLKMEDGAATCWFKATDNAGSVGRFTYLYFVDNTKPLVKIVTPTEKESCNGVFTVAGYAQDTNGITDISWQWGNESGKFDLTPGNPYFVKEVNSVGKDKSEDFIVSATDTMGNTVVLKRTIILNQEEDKPVVEIKYPAEGVDIENEEGQLFLRGIAKDDDRVVSVTYSVDGGEPQTLLTDGVFIAEITEPLEYGTHTITAFATDKNNVKGNPVKVTFTSRGNAPAFNKPTYKNGKNAGEYVEGMQFNPEGDAVYEISANSLCGLASMEYEFTWGKNGSYTGSANLSGGEKSASVKIPLNNPELPWGISLLTVTAKDVFGRETKYSSIINLTDLTKVYSATTGVFFNDSTVDEEGGVFVDPDAPLTGYFIGGNIASVTTVPSIKGVTAKADGNSIVVKANAVTDEFVVRVTTSAGATYDSKKLHFKVVGEAPVITLDDYGYDAERGIPFNFETVSDKLKVSGRVDADSQVKLKYHVLAVQTTLNNEVVTGSSLVETTEFTDLSVTKRGSFSIDGLKYDTFVDGVSVIEIVAETANGRSTAAAVFVRKIPLAAIRQVTDENGKAINRANPKVYWLKGYDFYGVGVYQGTLDNEFMYIHSADLKGDGKPITFTVSPTDLDPSKKAPTYNSEPLIVKTLSQIKVSIAKVDGLDYKSGMKVALDKGAASKDNQHIVTVKIKGNAPVTSVTYKISGEETVGGDMQQSGSASVRTIVDGEEYEADILLSNLPARVTDIAVTVKDARGAVVTTKGSIGIVRQHANIDNSEKIYWANVGEVVYDKGQKAYILEDGQSLYAFANVPGTISLRNVGVDGLTGSAEGNLIKVTPSKDGRYADVNVRANGENGSSYSSATTTFISDTTAPKINITGLENVYWINNKITINGTVSDANGIASVEFTYEDKNPSTKDKKGNFTSKEITWNKVNLKSGSFSVSLDVSKHEDGYIPLSVRAKDNTGKVAQKNYVFFKDTTAPEVEVLIPVAEFKKGTQNIINGENAIVFSVKDEGVVSKITYSNGSGSKSRDFEIYKRSAMVPKLTEKNEAGEEVNVRDERNPLKTMNQQKPNMRIGIPEFPLENEMRYSFTDAAGNVATVKSWDFLVDSVSDKPVCEIHLPTDNQVITTDFTISGVVYDDDGACQIYYKIDDGKWIPASEGYSSSYKIDKKLTEMTDNGHTVSVYAIDRNGVRGDVVSRRFRISLEEPKGAVESPVLDETVKETVTIRGWASDKNGIARVQVSIDNGATYNDAEGTTAWSYKFDTNVIQDGTHVVFVKIWDKYDITGVYSSLINIDNTPPELKLELPLDDSKTTKNLFFSGQTTDNIGLTELYLTVRSLEGKSIPGKLVRRDLTPSEIISQVLDISELSNGFYNVELTGKDAAGNITRVSRNIELDKSKPLSKVEVLYPLNGEHMVGEFNIYGNGYSENEDPIEKIELYLDGKLCDVVDSTTLTQSNYFKFHLKGEVKKDLLDTDPWVLTEGKHTYKAVATTASGKVVSSNTQTFIYSPYGPWITLENYTYGDFAVNRPMIKGDAGYALTPEEKELLRKKDTPSEIREVIEGKRVKQVYISFNNGKSYTPVSKQDKGKWSYRIENLDIPAGYHYLLVRAEMYNGESAVTRTIVQVDRTSPQIKLISPGEGGHYNQVLEFDGLSSDDVDLKDVKVSLRKGDKNSYEVPSFIQGMYFNANLLGATLWNVGAGLTFADGAVKIEADYGEFTLEERWFIQELFGWPKTYYRFGGQAISGKILAQVAYIPFRYFFGRDWDWLSATISLGANFTYFTDSGASATTGTKVPQMLSAVLCQVEFPRITLEKQAVFKNWSIYYEPQLWLIPSDVGGGAERYKFITTIGMHTTLF